MIAKFGHYQVTHKLNTSRYAPMKMMKQEGTNKK